MYRNDFNYNYAKTFGLFNDSSLIFGKCCYYKYNLKKKGNGILTRSINSMTLVLISEIKK